MKLECCANCSYFRMELTYGHIGSSETYHCDYHNLHDREILFPSQQICESFFGIKEAERERKINKILE